MFYLRWVMGITDGSMQYGGWTLDNVLILGTPLAGETDRPMRTAA